VCKHINVCECVCVSVCVRVCVSDRAWDLLLWFGLGSGAEPFVRDAPMA